MCYINIIVCTASSIG